MGVLIAIGTAGGVLLAANGREHDLEGNARDSRPIIIPRKAATPTAVVAGGFGVMGGLSLAGLTAERMDLGWTAEAAVIDTAETLAAVLAAAGTVAAPLFGLTAQVLVAQAGDSGSGTVARYVLSITEGGRVTVGSDPLITLKVGSWFTSAPADAIGRAASDGGPARGLLSPSSVEALRGNPSGDLQEAMLLASDLGSVAMYLAPETVGGEMQMVSVTASGAAEVA